MNENTKKIFVLYDGKTTSKEVALLLGLSPRYVRKIANRYDLLRLPSGARPGIDNHQFVCGRRIDPDGYVLITAPKDHPYARLRTNRKTKLIFEHRLILEQKLGRFLLPGEVADHIDGITIHNDPKNLRLFDGNGDHLYSTISGIPKLISKSGRLNLVLKNVPDESRLPVDIYHLRRERGDVRLRQILLALLLLDKDSPYLLGTRYWLEKAQIDTSSRSTIEHALAELDQQWAEDLSR